MRYVIHFFILERSFRLGVEKNTFTQLPNIIILGTLQKIVIQTEQKTKARA